jgi:hypothetical protein
MMVKKKEKKEQKVEKENLVEDWDFSEGFGGIPENVSLTKNIGCASNSGDKGKISSNNFSKTD